MRMMKGKEKEKDLGPIFDETTNEAYNEDTVDLGGDPFAS